MLLEQQFIGRVRCAVSACAVYIISYGCIIERLLFFD